MLTLRQRLFVAAYVGEARGNASRAAIAAGYSKRRAREAGHACVINRHIRAAIDEQLAGRCPGPAEVLARLGDQARGVGELLDVDEETGAGRVNLARARELGLLHLVKAVKPGKHGQQIEFADPQHALELLGRYYRLWQDGAAIDVKVLNVILDGLPSDLRDGVIRALEGALQPRND